MTKFFFWQKKPEKPQEKTDVVIFDDEETVLKKDMQRQKNQMVKEELKARIEAFKLEAEQKRLELQEQIEDQREDRYLRRLERQVRRAELEEELYGDDEEDEQKGDSPEAMLFSFLNNLMKRKQPQGTNNGFAIDMPSSLPQPEPQQMQPTQLSPERIKQIWNNLPEQYKAIAKNLSDEDLKRYIMNEMPTIDAVSLDQAVAIVRTN